MAAKLFWVLINTFNVLVWTYFACRYFVLSGEDADPAGPLRFWMIGVVCAALATRCTLDAAKAVCELAIETTGGQLREGK